MRQICIVICLFMHVAFRAYPLSRGRLEVINYKGYKSKFIEEGTWVRFFKNGKKYNSHFKILSDQSILFNSYTVIISQLQELSAQTFITQIDGVVLAVPGGGYWQPGDISYCGWSNFRRIWITWRYGGCFFARNRCYRCCKGCSTSFQWQKLSFIEMEI